MEPIQRLAQPYHTPMDQCVIQQCLLKIFVDDGVCDVYVDVNYLLHYEHFTNICQL